VKRLLKGLLKCWIYGSCAIAGLWGLGVVSCEVLIFVSSLPLFFFIMCGLFLPENRQGSRRYESLSDHSFDNTNISDTVLNASFVNNGDCDDDYRSSNRHVFSDDGGWNTGIQSGFGFNSHTIMVMDLNADLSINNSGSGVMSSGLRDL
jgi:hypothetical protein